MYHQQHPVLKQDVEVRGLVCPLFVWLVVVVCVRRRIGGLELDAHALIPCGHVRVQVAYPLGHISGFRDGHNIDKLAKQVRHGQ